MGGTFGGKPNTSIRGARIMLREREVGPERVEGTEGSDDAIVGGRVGGGGGRGGRKRFEKIEWMR